MSGRYARHGHNVERRQSATYRSWASMMTRCFNPRRRQWPDYGGRGITVCERWQTFVDFLADMGPRPSPKHSLDRYPNNDGPYAPGNVRWATRSEQRRNSRQALVNITADGKTMCLSDWARLTGIERRTISARIYKLGWPPHEAVTARPSLVKRAYR